MSDPIIPKPSTYSPVTKIRSIFDEHLFDQLRIPQHQCRLHQNAHPEQFARVDFRIPVKCIHQFEGALPEQKRIEEVSHKGPALDVRNAEKLPVSGSRRWHEPDSESSQTD